MRHVCVLLQRAPDKRAPPAVSLAFTAVVLLPLLAVVGYNLGVLKINFKVRYAPCSYSLQ